MNDREKMLAEAWRQAAASVEIVAPEEATIYERCATDLEALLTVPTLEEVLAEFPRTPGHITTLTIRWRSASPTYRVDYYKGTHKHFTADADTPLQAARECLRRVKE